jgi:hypothetical protein
LSVSGVEPSAFWIATELCRRLPCVMTTPLGSPVEPEVYCRKATVSRSVGSGSQRSPSLNRSVAIQRSAASSGACSATRPTSAAISVVVSTMVACASAMIACSRGSVRSRRVGSGG